jgi:hypothetical protein
MPIDKIVEVLPAAGNDNAGQPQGIGAQLGDQLSQHQLGREVGQQAHSLAHRSGVGEERCGLQ